MCIRGIFCILQKHLVRFDGRFMVTHVVMRVYLTYIYFIQQLLRAVRVPSNGSSVHTDATSNPCISLTC